MSSDFAGFSPSAIVGALQASWVASFSGVGVSSSGMKVGKAWAYSLSPSMRDAASKRIILIHVGGKHYDQLLLRLGFHCPTISRNFLRGQLYMRKRRLRIGTKPHSFVMLGPPGSGKSMIAKRIGLLHPLGGERAGLVLDPEHALVSVRPFRSPHSTISDIGLLGGGAIPAPDEISVAHNGVPGDLRPRSAK